MVRRNATRKDARLRLSVVSLCICGFAVVAPRPLVGEPADSVQPIPSAMRTRVYMGMWSTHLRDINRGLGNNSLLGLSYRGYFAATFINSYGDRAVSAGIQRNFSPHANGFVKSALGYRVGLLSGYDERFFGIGDKLPVIPFVQLVGNVDWRNLGVEFGYAGIVASVLFNLRL
jgi:hypothetical protein